MFFQGAPHTVGELGQVFHRNQIQRVVFQLLTHRVFPVEKPPLKHSQNKYHKNFFQPKYRIRKASYWEEKTLLTWCLSHLLFASVNIDQHGSPGKRADRQFTIEFLWTRIKKLKGTRTFPHSTTHKKSMQFRIPKKWHHRSSIFDGEIPGRVKGVIPKYRKNPRYIPVQKGKKSALIT